MALTAVEVEPMMASGGMPDGQVEGPSSPGTTTTISTIAVRAEPHSTVVVALLKSIDYVDLRIDKMRPRLLEIGSSAEENAQLLLIHTDLFQRLLGKEQQVEELLGRAEQLVLEQTEPGDVLVYEAMADGLAAAWKGLRRQLEMRGYILADTQKLHDLAFKHEELSKQLNSQLQMEADPTGGNGQTRRSVNELAELTRESMEIGSNVITQIRVLGSLADNADRPREAFEACLEIEKIMLKMAESWELLEGEWRDLKPRELLESVPMPSELQQEIRLETATFGPQLGAAEHYLAGAQEQFDKIRVKEEGEAGAIQLQTLVDQSKANQTSLQVLAETIYAQCTELPAEMSTKCADLLERYNLLLKEMQGRLELFERSIQWIGDAEAFLLQLAKMGQELGQADEAMAGELGPLAQQKGVALIEQGEQLVAHWIGEGGEAALREKVAEKVQELKGAVIEVVKLARERIAAGKAQKLGEKTASLHYWIRSIAEPFLSEPITLTPVAAEISEFLARHRRFGADLVDKEQQAQSVRSQQTLLGEGELDKLGLVQKRLVLLRAVLERRLQLGKKMEQLQKLSREFETSFHFLSSLLQQGELGHQKNTEQQVRHLLQSLNEHCIQEKHQSDGFQVLANAGQEKDPRLGLIEALGWSRAQISSHKQQLAMLTEQCEIWEQNRRRGVVELAGRKAPKFVMTLPDEKLIWEGQRLELAAKIDGDPEPSTFWLKDRLEVREVAGQCRIGWLNGLATLVIEEVLAEDAGEYVLRAENANGCAEGRIKLVVKPAPQQIVAANEGSSTNVFQQETRTTTTTTTTSTSRAVSSQGDHQQQQQQIVEELGEFKPRFVKQLQNVSVREGEQFQLDCVVVGNPEPKIIWYREEQTLRESDRFRLAFKGDHCTLTCRNASSEEAGLYKVLAANVHGETMNFCRLVIVPPSPKRKVPPSIAPKPTTPVQSSRTHEEGEEHLAKAGAGKEQQKEVGAEEKKKKPASVEPQLCSQIVQEGQAVVFQTFVDGSPTPEVHWVFNGQPVPAGRPDFGLSRDREGKCSLSIPCVLLEHAGQYGIEARNECGQASSSATLNVLEIGGPDAFGMEIDDFGEGQEFGTGRTTMGRHTERTEQKFITSRAVSGQQQQQFSMQQKQQLPDGGSRQQSYFSRWSTESPVQGPVYAVSKSERAESRRASSDMGDPGYSSLANAPECLRPFPAEVTIEEGERTELDCSMLGNPRPKVQWFFNERPIKSTRDFVEFTNIGDSYAIRFSPARQENAGWYRLVAENIKGRCEALTLVHVRPRSMVAKPGHGSQQRARRSIGGVQGLLHWQKQKVFQEQQARALSTPPRPLYLYSGGAATPPSPFAAQQHGQALLGTSQREWGQRRKSDQMPAVMSTSAYQARDEPEGGGPGIFDFSGAQPLVESHSEHRLISTDQLLLAQDRRSSPPQAKGSPPHFMQTLVSAVVVEGQSARFEAVVTGLPQPRLEWTKDGLALGQDENCRIWSEGGRAMLALSWVGAGDAGKYCCMAENASGMASSSAQLVLRPRTMAPDFVERLVSEEVEQGGPMMWTVRASGEPEPAVSWLRDGRPVQESIQGVRLIKDAPLVYSLLIGSIQLEDAGQFTCVLENIAGEARSTADLVVRPKGAAPGKYVHVTKVTQEKQVRGEELARNETVTIDGEGEGEEEVEREAEEEE